MKTLHEYEELIRQWGEDKGIYAQSTWQKQLEKWGSERAELLYAETDKERKDAFGDQYVCLVHVRNMYDGGTNIDILFSLQGHELDWQIIYRDFDRALTILWGDIVVAGYDPLECIAMAWEEIKDRPGKMVNGIFEKDA